MDRFQELLQSLSTCEFLSLDRNPVLTKRDLEVQLGEVILQYSYFPAAIVSVLRAGQRRLWAWTEIRDELESNIADELGSRTAGVPHVQLLVSALERELGLSLAGVARSSATTLFLKRLRQTVKRGQPATAGAIFAIESSAVPELTIVAEIVNRYAHSCGLLRPIDLEMTVPAIQNRSQLSLNAFFHRHVNLFEVDHRNHLAAILPSYIVGPQAEELCAEGFHAVLKAMDCWWRELARL